jgi:class 3 adenylate cyclase/tetratricopeptide (TPR) repeat protein
VDYPPQQERQLSDERRQLESTVAGLEAQRALLGDAVVEAALAPMRTRLATLSPVAPLRAEPSQFLRQVSILFMDVVGSTALSRALDPEDVADVLEGALARCIDVVRTCGGEVLRFHGDNLLAAFGAAAAREDDAERAVRCGLALLHAGRELAKVVTREYGWDGFAVRVGVHTGGALLGGRIEPIHGDAVHVAARMEQTAPAGGLRISHDTYRLVRGVFDVEPQPPIEVKGVAEPVQTYLVRAAKARAFRVAARGIEGVETRMVGRDGELEVLQDAFRRLFAERRLTAVSVIGEAGLGKSRLLYEFSNWAEARPERFLSFQGRATPQTQGQPYGLLRDVVAGRLEIADGEGMEVAKAKLEQALAPLFEPEDGAEMAQAQAHLLGYLIGLDFSDSPHVRGVRDDQRQIRNRAFHAAAEMFRRMCAQRGLPAVLELEDLHWADDASLEFLSYLGQVASHMPLLIVGLARPTLFERRADWIAGAEHARVDLLPFGKEASRELANELLKKLPEAPSALRELVGGGAEGNPFYMEELVKMLIDQRAIDTSGDVWRLDGGRLLAARVPPTLTGVLQARLDGLPAAERRALQEASVIGLVFWDQALAALDPEAPASLAPLERRELALPRADAAFAGMREYAFKHQILHQVTYETVLKRARRDLHARAAAWFAGLDDARASDFAATAARHYAQAGDEAAACEHYARAAEHARDRFANDAALELSGQALALADGVPEPSRSALRRRLLDVRARTFETQGRREEELAALDELSALADASGDNMLRADVALRRAIRAMRMGDWQAQAEAARASLAFAEAIGDADRRLQAQRLLASVAVSTGDAPAGRALAEAGLAEARALGLRKVESRFINALVTVAEHEGDFVGVLTLNRQTLDIVLELGDRPSEAVARVNLAEAFVRFGRFAEAAEQAEAALRLSRSIGLRMFESAASTVLSKCAALTGRDAQALAHAGAALQVAVETSYRQAETSALLALGDAEFALGRDAKAAGAFARAAVLAAETGMYLADALAGQARAALAQHGPAEALRVLEPVLAEIETGLLPGLVDAPHLVRLTCWQALDAAADRRAPPALCAARDALLAEAEAAARLDADWRRSLLEDHPAGRAILAAWRSGSV